MSLATKYLGLELSNPLVASASPLTNNLDNIRSLEDAGVGAIVLPSLFQEQIEAEAEARISLVEAYADSSPEARTYFHASASGPYGLRPDRYLDLVRRAKEAVAIPVIASLNGSSRADWIDHAKLIEEAGAAAIELNLYQVPTDLFETGRDVEARYIEIVNAVTRSIALPVAVKLMPYVSSPGDLAMTLVEHGAAGLVLFNRVLEPDIDLGRMQLIDTLPLSDPSELRQPMLWISILSGRTGASLAASGGVATVDDVVKYLLAGADVVMTASALLRNGVSYMTTLVDGLQRWLAERDVASLDTLRGIMSWQRRMSRDKYARANYLRILEGYSSR